jgi:hypothetical protein
MMTSRIDYDPLYTEENIGRLVADHRVLALIEAYSMNVFPLGEVELRAGVVEEFEKMQPLGRLQLIHEVAERIADGRFLVPKNLRERFPEAYDGNLQRTRDLHHANALRFSELQRPNVKRNQLQLYRRTFSEDDVVAIAQDEKALSGIYAYRTGLIGFKELKEKLYGDFYYNNPFNLSFDAFQKLCFEVIRRMDSGTITLAPNWRQLYANVFGGP